MVRHIKTCFALATVNDHTYGDRFGAMRSALIECLDYAATASDDIFNYKYLFARYEFEISAQRELVVYFFKEYEA